MTPYGFGSKAYRDGMKCIPALDQDFLDNFIAPLIETEDVLPHLDDWLRGWTDANLVLDTLPQ